MDELTIIRVGYFFAPQDRRKIGEKMMSEYVLDHYRDIFGDHMSGEHDEAGRSVLFNLTGVDKKRADDAAEEFSHELGLTMKSFYTVMEIKDTVEAVPADAKHPKRSEKMVGLLAMVDRLMGMESFKKLCHDIVSISESPEAEKQQEHFDSCAFLFAIHGGDGYTYYINLLRTLLKECGAKVTNSSLGVKEVKKAQTYEEMIDIISDSDYEGEILSFDLTYKVEKADTEEFRDFIRKMHFHQGTTMPIFKIPYSEGEEKERVIRVLSSVFPLHVIDVPPFTNEQYTAYAIQMLEAMGYKVQKVAHDEIEDLIVQKRNQQHFYGFNSINALTEEIAYQKTRSEIRRKADMSLVIREKDLEPMLQRSRAEQGGLDALDEMIGIEEVRARIDEILVQLQISSKLPNEERPSMHMLFSGNPGTGKTTVARILGRVLKEQGVLSKGLFFERTGREFVGKYIGETAPITNAICRDAYGSVLFIDEAYTLYRGDDERDFGKEALDTLLTQMENHRQDFIVIFSGYSDRMKEMLDANPGLKSRIPHEIKFSNYSQDELFRIYMSMAKRTYAAADDLEAAAGRYFLDLSDAQIQGETFSNARFVRNLYERTVAKAAMRLQTSSGGRIRDTSQIILTGEDFRQASKSEEFQDLLRKKATYGFI